MHLSLSLRLRLRSGPAAARNWSFPSRTQGSQIRSTLGYSYAVPQNARHCVCRGALPLVLPSVSELDGQLFQNSITDNSRQHTKELLRICRLGDKLGLESRL